MAHIKVVRRSMQEPEWIRIRTKWLSQRLIRQRVENSGWQIREARQVGEAGYEYVDSDYRAVRKGDMMFSPDGTAFLRLDTVIPAELAGKEVWLYMETAAEMQVRCNGRWLGALDPNRNRVLIAEQAGAEDPVRLEIEAYSRSYPDDQRHVDTMNLRGCRQSFGGSAFVEIDRDILAALYDINVLSDTMKSGYVREEIRNYIQKHLHAALNMIDCGERDPQRYSESVRRLRDYLEGTVFSSRVSKGFDGCGRVALVAHSHLDIAYFWRRIHTVQKNARTCLIQLRLMDRYPDFHYSHSQAFTFETLEKHYPELFDEVKKRVEEGRFEPVGGLYVEPDCNLPTAESLVRQCFYGQHYFRSRFGLTVRNCWLPDVFGNSWIMPQILRKSGIDYFVSNKMSTWNDTNRFPYTHFIWRGIDGTDIPACVPPVHFVTNNDPDRILENWADFHEKETAAETLHMYGYGDGGSGVTEQMLEYQARLPKVPGMPLLRHCRADRFLEDNLSDKTELKVWDDELYLEMHRGTFTTKAELKAQNRRLEILLRDAELAAAFAVREGFEYPCEELSEAWKLLLVNQFHDIIPGTHVAPVTRDALADYRRIGDTAEKVLEAAMAALGYSGGGDSVILFNTLSWPRCGAVFVAGELNAQDGAAPCSSQPGVRNGEKGLWLEFTEEDPMPAMSGIKLENIPAGGNSGNDWFSFDGRVIQTPLYRIVLEQDGSISSLIDLRFNRELVSEGGRINKLAAYHDYPGTYDAWDILHNYTEVRDEISVDSQVKQTASGPVCAEFSASWRLGESSGRQSVRIFHNDPRIEFDHDVDWRRRHRLVKALFDFNILARRARCDTSAGTIERETHRNTSWQQARFEVCHHKWLDLAEGDYGVAVLNESKYGVSFDGSKVGLSLLRGPMRPDPNSDCGRHRFSYALLPHAGAAENAGIIRSAWAFNTPVRVARGGAGRQEPLIKVDSANLHVQAVKRPQDGSDGIIVRLLETHGTRGRAKIAISGGIKKACRTNLLEDVEQEEGGDDFRLESGRLAFDYKPYEIVTFCLQAGGDE